MAERRSRGWKMLFVSRRLISLPQTTINPGSLWLISRGQRENKWQMGSGWVRYLSCAGSTPEASSLRRAASGVSGTRTGCRLVASSSFCGWLKQKYKEKCSCLVAWHETVRSNKARAMDVNVFWKHSCIDDLPFAEVVAAVPRFQRLCWSINTTQQSFREELCWKVGFILRAENLWTRFVIASLFLFLIQLRQPWRWQTNFKLTHKCRSLTEHKRRFGFVFLSFSSVAFWATLQVVR